MCVTYMQQKDFAGGALAKNVNPLSVKNMFLLCKNACR